jgi:3-oxoacyl-[acyl-carrier-protein] synthase II
MVRRVVVTGLGALTPIGNNVQEYWNTNQRRKWCCSITTSTLQSSKLNLLAIENFNAEDFLDRKEARKMDRYAQYAMVLKKQ